MYQVIRICTILFAASALVSCGQDKGAGEGSPESQQLARMNRELATLEQTVAALHVRVDRMAGADAVPSPKTETETATLIVVVTADGYQIKDETVADNALLQALRSYADAKGDAAQVLIQAGPEVAHARVMRVMDLAKESGIGRLALQIEPPPR